MKKFFSTLNKKNDWVFFLELDVFSMAKNHNLTISMIKVFHLFFGGDTKKFNFHTYFSFVLIRKVYIASSITEDTK